VRGYGKADSSLYTGTKAGRRKEMAPEHTSPTNGCERAVLEIADGKVWRTMTSQSVHATKGTDWPPLFCICVS